MIRTVLCCIVHDSDMHTYRPYEQFLKLTVVLEFLYISVCFLHVFRHFVPMLFTSVVLGLVSSVLSQKIGWKEHLRNYLLCVDVKS